MAPTIIADGKLLSTDEVESISYDDYLLTETGDRSYTISINMCDYYHEIILNIKDGIIHVEDVDSCDTLEYEALCCFLGDNYECFTRLHHSYISGLCQAIRSWKQNMNKTRDAHLVGTYLLYTNYK